MKILSNEYYKEAEKALKFKNCVELKLLQVEKETDTVSVFMTAWFKQLLEACEK
jgi:hypothetical protein